MEKQHSGDSTSTTTDEKRALVHLTRGSSQRDERSHLTGSCGAHQEAPLVSKWRKLCCYFGQHRIAVEEYRIVHHSLRCVDCGKKFVSSLFGVFEID